MGRGGTLTIRKHATRHTRRPTEFGCVAVAFEARPPRRDALRAWAYVSPNQELSDLATQRNEILYVLLLPVPPTSVREVSIDLGTTYVSCPPVHPVHTIGSESRTGGQLTL